MPNVTLRSKQSPFWGLSNFRDFDSAFEDILSPWVKSQNIGFSPACNIEENDTSYLVTFDLPGIDKKEIQIEVKDNQLFVSGQRKENREHTEGKQLISERYTGQFSRSFALPSQVNASKVGAQYKDGVLTISVPKSEEAKAQKVVVS